MTTSLRCSIARAALLLPVCAVTLPTVSAAGPDRPQETFFVTSTGDADTWEACASHTDPCTLRGAINAANDSPGLDAIVFDIPGSGPHTISPLSALPVITDPLIIDGFSQSGDGTHDIEISGALAVADIIATSDWNAAFHGLVLAEGSDRSTIRGLVINTMPLAGILVYNSDHNRIVGNYLGIDATGLLSGFHNGDSTVHDALPNEVRATASNIRVEGSSHTIIGTSDPLDRNVLGSSRRGAIAIVELDELTAFPSFTEASIGTVVQGNYLGVGSDGSTRLLYPNESFSSPAHGIFLGHFSRDTLIGGPHPGAGNVISNSGANGIILLGARNSSIVGNLIGTDSTGTVEVKNRRNGVAFVEILDNELVVGNRISGNVISGNGERGLAIRSGIDTQITNNKIGTDTSGRHPIPNGLEGIFMDDFLQGIAKQSLIEGNLVAYNAGAGMALDDAPAVRDIAMLENSVHSNGGLGIDLWESVPAPDTQGVTINDDRDADEDQGGNRLQNYPEELVAKTAGRGKSMLLFASGVLRSEPDKWYRIEFFASSEVDASGFGEGEFYLGFVNVMTDGQGEARFHSVQTGWDGEGRALTATATELGEGDQPLSTSEFSAAVPIQGVP